MLDYIYWGTLGALWCLSVWNICVALKRRSEEKSMQNHFVGTIILDDGENLYIELNDQHSFERIHTQDYVMFKVSRAQPRPVDKSTLN